MGTLAYRKNTVMPCVAARPPHYPDAEKSPAKHLIADIAGNDPTSFHLRETADSPKSAMQGPAKFGPSKLTPDHFAVNTMLPPYAGTDFSGSAKPGKSANKLLKLRFSA